MNIHEHQAKKILENYGAKVPKGIFAFKVDDLLEKANTLKKEKYILKAQIHSGGRGKAGGVKLVNNLDELEKLVAQTSAVLGIVTTPAIAAQEVVDCLVEAGIRSILNFAPVVVDVIDEVEVRRVDLATEFQILGYYDHLRKFD